MKKIIIVIILLFIIYPFIEIKKENKIYKFSYSESYGEFEENLCYSESYSYNEKRDISIYNWDVKKFLFFKILVLEFKEGNVCETEYYLEHDYILNFIENAEIEENEWNIDVAKLIENKEPIESNTRYTGNEYDKSIYYKLDGKYEVMYIFNKDDLVIFQIGYSDEGPKYIAYK